MVRGLLLVTFGIMTVSATPALAQKKGDGAAFQNGWLSSLSEGKARAQKLNKPMMVVVRCVP